MFDSITFSVGKKTIILHEQEFTLGDIPTQILNLTYCEIRRRLETLNQAKALSRQYEGKRAVSSGRDGTAKAFFIFVAYIKQFHAAESNCAEN